MPAISPGDIRTAHTFGALSDKAGSTLDAWTILIGFALEAPMDPTTLSTWAAVSAISVGALRQRCYAAGVTPRQSLLLARLLRAVLGASGRRWEPTEWLRCADVRTLRSMLRLGRLPRSSDSGPTARDFLCSQTILKSEHPAVQALLFRCDNPKEGPSR